MVLLRRVIGDALRARRQGQHRTLREVSTAANVSLGYLSEIERGQKEPPASCSPRSVTPSVPACPSCSREVSDTFALAEQMAGRARAVQDEPAAGGPRRRPKANREVPRARSPRTARSPSRSARTRR